MGGGGLVPDLRPRQAVLNGGDAAAVALAAPVAVPLVLHHLEPGPSLAHDVDVGGISLTVLVWIVAYTIGGGR